MMNKIAQFLSILLIVALVLFWSASILAAEAETDALPESTDAERVTIELATDATEDAAEEAAKSIATDTKLDLDIRLIGRSSLKVAAS